MIIIPTAELRGSTLYPPGSHRATTARVPIDAIGTHRAFAAAGFQQVHLYDLDADSGRDLNETLIAEIVRDALLDVIVSGGSICEDRVERLLDAGVSQVIVCLTEHDDIDSLAPLAESVPGQLIVRLDVGDAALSRPTRRRKSSAEMLDLANDLSSIPIGGIFVHGLSSDGFPGSPLRFVEDVVEVSSVPVFCRTEATSVGELWALEHLGIAAALLGSSLYDGQLDAGTVAHHFDS